MRGLDQDRLVELVQVVVRNPLRAFLSSLGVGWGLFMIIITVGGCARIGKRGQGRHGKRRVQQHVCLDHEHEHAIQRIPAWSIRGDGHRRCPLASSQYAAP